jgi:cation diffusion facilitator family transporter
MHAHKEKASVALNSVAAALFLTGLKLTVGLLSNSVGVLAEAAHSGLDCVTALVTLYAVRASSKPPDREHPYGHGKVETLSALIETVLLLATCYWIASESIHRLTSAHSPVDASIWTFGVIIVSIFVDISRSRMLYRAAEKHHSQALEADALHFSTDIWSSAVVLLGLAGVKLAGWFPSLAPLAKADAVAALVVAFIVVMISGRLAWRTVEGLLDAAPAGVPEQIRKRVEEIEGVCDCHAVRVRRAGPGYFVDLHVTLDGEQTLRAAHELSDRIEAAVQELLPETDITVHPEPAPSFKPPPSPPSSPNG